SSIIQALQRRNSGYCLRRSQRHRDGPLVMIEEQMIHGMWRERRGQESGDRRKESGVKRQEAVRSEQQAAVWSVKALPRKPIEVETPIGPYAVAAVGGEEGSACPGGGLPPSWVGRLT